MADQLTLIDGGQRVREDWPAGRLYELAARIEGVVTRPTAAQIGPALNALYAQALAALCIDRSLGSLASDVREGGSDLQALEIEINHEAYTAPTGIFGLNIVVPYWQSESAPPLREPILEALTSALAANVPGPSTARRELVLAAFQTHLAGILGLPVLRNADRPLDGRQPGPVLVFTDGNQGADYETVRRAFYFAHAAVEVFVPTTDGAVLDVLVQQVLVAIRSAGQLGGLAVDVMEADTDPDILRDQYTGPLLAARLEAECIFATPVGNPYAGVT